MPRSVEGGRSGHRRQRCRAGDENRTRGQATVCPRGSVDVAGGRRQTPHKAWSLGRYAETPSCRWGSESKMSPIVASLKQLGFHKEFEMLKVAIQVGAVFRTERRLVAMGWRLEATVATLVT